MSTGLPTTILPDEDVTFVAQLDEALGSADVIAELSTLVAQHPTSSTGWAYLGENARTRIERYAFFRVGYHRGLDALRRSGWRGSGYVRWSAPSNVGFLRCLRGLGEAASAIGEMDEAERCALFLAQLDPSGGPFNR